MSMQVDVIVAGLGAMGSAALYHLAKRGASALGIDQFSPPHDQGSSHGLSRIIREAYFEHPIYVPIVQRAYELWAELQTRAETQLFIQTGGVMLGAPQSVVVQGALRSARTWNLPHELLSAEEVTARFPGLRPGPGMQGVLEPRAGILLPEKCVAAHLSWAEKMGAAVHRNERILRWEKSGGLVRVMTDKGSYAARQLIVSAGAWAQSLLPELNLHLRVERQVLYWFEPVRQPELFHPSRFPVHLWEYRPGLFFYGFPDLGDGVKVARHHQGPTADPDRVDRHVSDCETNEMRDIVREFLPAANGALRLAAVCLYTNTPHEHFLIDRHPVLPEVLIASPCSGHGFKFSSAIGEILADLALSGKSSFDLSLFSFAKMPVGKV